MLLLESLISSGFGIALWLIYYYRKMNWMYNIPVLINRKYWYELIMGTAIRAVKSYKLCQIQKDDFNRLDMGLGKLWLSDMLITKNPKLICEILYNQNPRKPTQSYRIFNRIIGVGKGNFVSMETHKCPLYQNNRRLVYTTLMDRVHGMYPNIIDCIQDHIPENDGIYKVSTICHKIATSVITKIGFGLSDIDSNFLFHTMAWLVRDGIERPENIGIPILDWIPTKRNMLFWKNRRKLRDFLRAEVEIKKNLPNSKLPDIIEVMAKVPTNTTDDVVGMLAIFYLAGQDTTSNAMQMLMYLLSSRPKLQEKLRREIKAHGKINNISDLFNLDLLRSCFFETLRLYPSVQLISREIPENLECPYFKANQKKTGAFGINLNLYGAHRHYLNCEKPNEFIPERFIDDGNGMRPRFFAPFSLGQRSCIGRQLALVEAMTTLREILMLFELKEVTKKHPIVREKGTLEMDPNFKIQFQSLNQYDEDIINQTIKSDNIDCFYGNIPLSITKYAQYHPGGSAVLQCFNGCDIKEEFDAVHAGSIRAHKTLANLFN